MGKKKYSKEVIESMKTLIREGKKNATIAREVINLHDLDKSFDTVWKRVNKVRLSMTNVPANTKSSEILNSRGKKSEEKPRVLSAWNDSGYMMDIDEYCDHYKLPRADVQSYKLVSHTGTPYYNILFKEYVEIDKESFEETLNRVLEGTPEVKKIKMPTSKIVDRLIYTDVHTGMDSYRNGLALYGTKWDEKELNRRVDIMINTAIAEKKSDTLIVDELGDLMDGWNGKTTREGHALPQNMDNETAFDVALSFKVKMANAAAKHWEVVIFNNICEDNHSGAFGYNVNSAFKRVVDVSLKNVVVNNHRKFFSHYVVGKHCFVITHGKDSKNMKYGLKVHSDAKQVETIDQYLKIEGIYKKAEYIEITKGDSHQFLYDACSSDDFDYFNVMAFSPSSEWVQMNYKKGRSGFVIQHIHTEINRKDTTPFWF